MFFFLSVMAAQLEMVAYLLDLPQVEGYLQFPLVVGEQLWLPLQVEGEVFSLVFQLRWISLLWPLEFWEGLVDGELVWSMMSLVWPFAHPQASLLLLLSLPLSSLPVSPGP